MGHLVIHGFRLLLLGPLADQNHPDSQTTHNGRPFASAVLYCTYVETMERAGRLRKGPSRMAGSSISGAEKDGQNCSQNVQIKNTHPPFDPSNTTTHVHACSHSFMSLSAPPHCGCTAVPTALPCPALHCPSLSSIQQSASCVSPGSSDTHCLCLGPRTLLAASVL
ncbi:hypothetical protein JOL62DRAFT_59939 [Phyllosticta paracitricarpa]|uniref:Uncharacterized protein n=1 Tax=Phyllosticta paracitricarpa TaxID=2016321 RepID=A0ABR1N8J2_9PEZI